MMGYRDRIVGFLALFVFTLGFLGESGRAFTPASRLPILSQSIAPTAFGVTSFAKEQATTLRVQARKSGEGTARFQLFRRNRSEVQQNVRTRVMNQFRRAFAIMWMAALLWFGGAKLNVPPSYASTTALPSEPIISRVIPKGASLDRIVDKYVKDHMFDDDVYDPLESSYIEAYDDATTGRYPRALNEVASSLLGTDVTKSEKKSSENMFISALSNGSKGLQSLGLSATAATVIVYAVTLIGAPSAVLIGILAYANAQKRMRIRQNKKRYGVDYRYVMTEE